MDFTSSERFQRRAKKRKPRRHCHRRRVRYEMRNYPIETIDRWRPIFRGEFTLAASPRSTVAPLLHITASGDASEMQLCAVLLRARRESTRVCTFNIPSRELTHLIIRLGNGPPTKHPPYLLFFFYVITQNRLNLFTCTWNKELSRGNECVNTNVTLNCSVYAAKAAAELLVAFLVAKIVVTC